MGLDQARFLQCGLRAGLAEETDYDNFKSEAGRHQERQGAAYQKALHDVWSVMHRLQK